MHSTPCRHPGEPWVRTLALALLARTGAAKARDADPDHLGNRGFFVDGASPTRKR